MADDKDTEMEARTLYLDWRNGMPYDKLHEKYGPWAHCECESCETKRRDEP